MAEKGTSRRKQALDPLYSPLSPKSLMTFQALTLGPVVISPAT